MQQQVLNSAGAYGRNIVVLLGRIVACDSVMEGGRVESEAGETESPELTNTESHPPSGDTDDVVAESDTDQTHGLTETSSTAYVSQKDLAEVIRRRRRLERSFFQECSSLSREFSKGSPSSRYLWKGLELAEQLQKDLLEALQVEIDNATDLTEDDVLADLRQAICEQNDLLAEVSSYLENAQHWQGAHTRSQTAHGVAHVSSQLAINPHAHSIPVQQGIDGDASTGAESDSHVSRDILSIAGMPSSSRTPVSVTSSSVSFRPLDSMASSVASLQIGSMFDQRPKDQVQKTTSSVEAASMQTVSMAPATSAVMNQSSSGSASFITAGVATGQSSAVTSGFAPQTQVSNVSTATSFAAQFPSATSSASTATLPGVATSNTGFQSHVRRSTAPLPAPMSMQASRAALRPTNVTVNMPPLPAYGQTPMSSRMSYTTNNPSVSVHAQPVSAPMPGMPGYASYGPVMSQSTIPGVGAIPVNSHLQGLHGYGHGSSYLKPMALPKFSGHADEYIRWKQRFLQVVDADQYMPEDYKLARLREALEGGKAADMVSGIFDGVGAYQAVWQELESWYGGSDRHIEQERRAIISHPRITNDKDIDALQRYAVKLRNVLANMRTCGIVPGEELYLIASEKIPRSMLVRYFEKYGQNANDIDTFSTWLVERLKTLKRASERTAGPPSTSDKLPQPLREQRRHRALTANNSSSASSAIGSSPSGKAASGDSQTICPKCRGAHALLDCASFKSLATPKRWDLVKLLDLCSRCLKPGHFARECKAASCSKCSGGHSELLHYVKRERVADKPDKQAAKNQAESSNVSCCATSNQSPSFMTVKVHVKGQDGLVEATAFLDSGSSCTFMTKELHEKLNLPSSIAPLSTTVLGGKVLSGDKEVLALEVSSLDGEHGSKVEAWVMPQITVPVESVDWELQKSVWPHLQDVPTTVNPGKTVDMLIGLDAANPHVSLEERTAGTEGGPIARRTPLGWICFGPGCPPMKPKCDVTLIAHPDLPDPDKELNELVKQFWILEAVGMAPMQQPDALTPEEQAAEKSTVESLHHDGQRFEVGIPWCDGIPNVQSNLSMAKRRLHSLMRLLQKKPDIQVRYAKVLTDYLNKGYIKRVSAEEIARGGSNQWFLPHFAVVREDKTTTKLRVVFDGAARMNSDSACINDLMHTGPKLQNNLTHVILRFCLEPIALAADISEMFLQVGLRQADRKFHRFVWQEEPKELEETVFEFKRLVFGMKASPYLAGRALLETATKFGNPSNVRAQQAVRENFYVDDMLASVDTAASAVQLRSQVQVLLADGGFHIRKWLSNSPTVMSSIPQTDRATNADLVITEHDSSVVGTQKALGVMWSCKTDCFSYQYAEPTSVELTRRGVLSQMCRLFDPRGQLCPFTIRGRVMFQEACICNTGWDEPLDPVLAGRWKQWFAEIPDLHHIQIPRCFKSPDASSHLSLHTFTDASDIAYAAAVYTHQMLPSGSAKVTLAMAKARPSPIRKKTIPILELQGAVLGTRLATEVATALNIPPEQRYYWTDSMNVLYWVRSPSRKFRVDVANRVGQIQKCQSRDSGNMCLVK